MQATLAKLTALLASSLLAFPFSLCAQPAGNAATRALQRAMASDLKLLFPPLSEDPRNQTKSPPRPPQAPSLKDLGISQSQIEGNPKEQQLLDRRSHILKIHQRLGLITAVPMLATLITSGGAAGRGPVNKTSLDLHAALGAATTGLYFTTAYYAIFAPGLPGTKTRGPIRVHKGLAWIHGPGMILTGVLGGLAYEQRSRGERVHGIASAHSAVAWVTAAAFGAAIVSVSFKF
jgi:hypothetical protein